MITLLHQINIYHFRINKRILLDWFSAALETGSNVNVKPYPKSHNLFS